MSSRFAIAMGLLILLMGAAVAGSVWMAFEPMREEAEWQRDNPQLVDRFEQECNDRLDPIWEFSGVADHPESDDDNYTIYCSVDTGFLSSSTEEIEVSVQ